MYDIIALNNKLSTELKEIARDLNIPKYEALKKQELIYKILDFQALNPAPEDIKVEEPRKVRIFRSRRKKDIPNKCNHCPNIPKMEGRKINRMQSALRIRIKFELVVA